MEVGSFDFCNVCVVMVFFLVKVFFDVDGVVRVFFGVDFVIVVKVQDVFWDILKFEIFVVIMDFYVIKQFLFYGFYLGVFDIVIDEDDDDIVVMMKELFEICICFVV